MTLTRCKPFLGTYVEISVVADIEFDALASLSNAAFDVIAQYQALMSFHDETSELSKLNRSAHLESVVISARTYSVLYQSLLMAKVTNGLFDPTIAPQLTKQSLLPRPTELCVDALANWQDIQLSVVDGTHSVRYNKPLWIDLGGIAKGAAVDAASKVITSQCPEAKVMINAGGDISFSHWQNESIYIASPRKQEALIKMKMNRPCVATTSYNYQNGKMPIINPHTQEPLQLKHSVSVFADSCIIADALTKVIAIDPASSFHNHFNAAVITISNSGDIQHL